MLKEKLQETDCSYLVGRRDFLDTQGWAGSTTQSAPVVPVPPARELFLMVSLALA